jgi:hypothetical protein
MFQRTALFAKFERAIFRERLLLGAEADGVTLGRRASVPRHEPRFFMSAPKAPRHPPLQRPQLWDPVSG